MNQQIPIEKNKKYTMTVTGMGNEGQGIGKIDGFTVFVEGALLGEEIEALIIKLKKNFAYGKLVKIITPSAFRIEPVCMVAKQCGGCQLQHMSYEGQLNFKRKKVKDDLERIGKLQDICVLPILGMEEPYFYRNKAQFPVGYENGKVSIGFYAQRSHRIIDVQTCWLQHPVNDVILKIIREFLQEYQISIYDEKSHKGLVRHILTRVAQATGEIMVCIVMNGKSIPYADILSERLQQVPGMTSILFNENRQQTNVILGKPVKTLWGKSVITDNIDSIQFEISPLSFYQVNAVQTKTLYRKALELAQLQGNEIVWDLYCGIGTISLFFAQKAKRVIGVEIVPQAIADAKRNAEINGINNVDFIAGAAEDVVSKLYQIPENKADVVVVDPPRKGCDIEVLHTMIEMCPKKIIYVSCDPATLARDLQILCHAGYEVKVVQPVDLFPMTRHVEVVVSICRKDT